MLIPPLKIIFAPSCARVSKLFANSLQNLTCADMRGRRRLAAPIETISDIARRIARYRQTFMFAARDMPLTGDEVRGGRLARPCCVCFSLSLSVCKHIPTSTAWSSIHYTMSRTPLALPFWPYQFNFFIDCCLPRNLISLSKGINVDELLDIFGKVQSLCKSTQISLACAMGRVAMPSVWGFPFSSLPRERRPAPSTLARTVCPEYDTCSIKRSREVVDSLPSAQLLSSPIY